MKIKVGSSLVGLRRFYGWSIICAAAILVVALFGCASRTFNPSSADLSFAVMKLKGQARWKTGANEWQPLLKNQTVHAGMVIETAQNSQVDLLLIQRQGPDQSAQTASSLNRTDLRHTEPPLKDSQDPYSSARRDLRVRIWDNTRLAFSQLTCENKRRKLQLHDAALDLQTGHIFLAVPPLSADARFEIHAPDFSVRVQARMVDVNSDGIVKVLDGSALVQGTNYSQVVLSQQMFDARTGVLSMMTSGSSRIVVPGARLYGN
jgi:hypothetical protein